MSREANERHEHRSPARSNHPRPPRNHHRRSLLPRPGAGEQAQGLPMMESTQEGVGGNPLNGFNELSDKGIDMSNEMNE